MSRPRIALLLTVLPILPPIAEAQLVRNPAPPTQRAMSVSGSADIKVKPDFAVITLGVETKNPELDAAKSENDERVKRVLGFLKASGLGPGQVQTDFISIEPSYQWNDSKTVTHFTVQKTIVVTLRDLGRFDLIIDGAVSRGITAIHGVDFRTGELKKHREHARALAVRAALEKAQKLGAEAGARPGRVLSLSENGWGGSSSWTPGSWGRRSSSGYGAQVSYAAAPGQSDDSPGTLALGEIVVSATVSMTVELE